MLIFHNSNVSRVAAMESVIFSGFKYFSVFKLYWWKKLFFIWTFDRYFNTTFFTKTIKLLVLFSKFFFLFSFLENYYLTVITLLQWHVTSVILTTWSSWWICWERKVEIYNLKPSTYLRYTGCPIGCVAHFID